MAYKAKPPVVSATRTVPEIVKASRLNSSPYSRNASDLQDIVAAIVARRYGLSPCIARVVVELSNLGGQLS